MTLTIVANLLAAGLTLFCSWYSYRIGLKCGRREGYAQAVVDADEAVAEVRAQALVLLRSRLPPREHSVN